MAGVVGWLELLMAIVVPVTAIVVFFDAEAVNARASDAEQVGRLSRVGWALGCFGRDASLQHLAFSSAVRSAI